MQEQANKRPRICQVLGVGVGERFRVESDSCCLYPEAFVDEEGIVRASVGQAMDGMRICQIIKGELCILRKPRFTEEEVAKAAYLHGAWGANARLWRTSSNTLILEQGEGLWLLPNEWFPSLRPGQAVRLEDIAKQ